jgi:hypothetical protein
LVDALNGPLALVYDTEASQKLESAMIDIFIWLDTRRDKD